MDDNIDNLVEEDILDGILELEKDYDIDFSAFYPITIDSNSSNDRISESSISSGESNFTCNSIENSSYDISINLSKWQFLDPVTKRKRPPRLYEFLILLLRNPHYISYASFTNKSQGIFQIHKPEKVAYLWEQVKNRQSSQKMTYEKFARAIRWYYKDGIMQKTNTRHTFQFSPKLLESCITDENNNITTVYSYLNQ